MSVDTQSTGLSIASAMAEVARTFHNSRTVDQALELVIHAATDTIAGIDHASVTVCVKDGHCETTVATGELANRADQVQYEVGEGPCLDALRTRELVQTEGLPDEERWPSYVPRAAELGVRSQMAYPLHIQGRTLGGLNLYSTSTDTLDPDIRYVAELFATHASLTLGRVHEEDNLNTALATRKTIGQAIGIIQERHGMSEQRAFQFLAQVSQTSNIKLRDVATELVKRSNDQAAEKG